MATPSKQPKLTYETLAEQSKEKEINDLKNRLEKQIVGSQEQYDVLRHPLDHLPDKVQLNIFKFLDFGDIIRCAQVSNRVATYVADHEGLLTQ